MDLLKSAIRDDIPFLKEVVYFDSASVCPISLPVIKAMNEFYLKYPYNYGVGAFRDSIVVRDKIDNARAEISEFIGAESSNEIIFTKNTTEALNLVATGLRFREGDEVIISNLEHQSNIIPWMILEQQKRIRLKIVYADESGMILPEKIESLLTKKTKLVSITHVSNTLGTIQCVKEIGRMVKDNGSLFMLDGAQSAGRVPIDVRDIGCDFMAFCGRKALMGPQGTGFLYGRKASLDEMSPMISGSRAGNVTGENSFGWNQIPHRFEAGIINTSGFIGLAESIRYLKAIGMVDVRERISHLADRMIQGLGRISGVRILGSRNINDQAGIASWTTGKLDPTKFATELFEKHRIAVASGSLGSFLALKQYGVSSVVRTSVHFFNTEDEIDVLIQATKNQSART